MPHSKDKPQDSFEYITSHITRLRKVIKLLPENRIQTIIENLKNELARRKEAKKQEEQNSIKSKIASQQIIDLMTEHNIEQKKVIEMMGTMNNRRKKAQRKYRVVVDGEEHFWTGRGRPPAAFRELKEKDLLHTAVYNP